MSGESHNREAQPEVPIHRGSLPSVKIGRSRPSKPTRDLPPMARVSGLDYSDGGHVILLSSASNTVAGRREDDELAQHGVIAGGRMHASAVLMQLICCGSIPGAAKRNTGPGGAGGARYSAQRRLPRGRSDLSSSTAAGGFSGSIGVGIGIEREYFSGSLVETKKTASGDRAGHGGELRALKRSLSYNADRDREPTMNAASTTSGGCKMELSAEEVDGVRAPAASRRQGNPAAARSFRPATSTLAAGAATNRNFTDQNSATYSK